ncbi:MAG: AzlD domain-containing protein [Paracoccaceae bacterium]
MTYSAGQIWLIIALLGAGTFAIRFSFLGLIGNRPLPPFALRVLRFTPVAVLPGMVAPLILWPPATDGVFDPVRFACGLVTLVVGIWTRSFYFAVVAGAITLYGGLLIV